MRHVHGVKSEISLDIGLWMSARIYWKGIWLLWTRS